MITKEDLQYTKTHEWLQKLDNGNVRIGITDYAQDALGDLVFVNLPQPGDAVTAGETFGDLESVKAVSDLFSPVTGEVAAVNEELLDAPEKMNEAPYDAWLIEVTGVTDTEELLNAADYEALTEKEG